MAYVDLEDIGVPDAISTRPAISSSTAKRRTCVLTNDEGRVVVSFRGKDLAADWNDVPKVEDGTYIDYFMPLLLAVAGAYRAKNRRHRP